MTSAVGASRTGMQQGRVETMTTQIAVRLPDEVVAFLDRQVAQGQAASRAALVTAALQREMRRRAALDDAAILDGQGAADELDGLVGWSARQATVED